MKMPLGSEISIDKIKCPGSSLGIAIAAVEGAWTYQLLFLDFCFLN
jgi:hypothetical protein